jgi:hypothetical protein
VNPATRTAIALAASGVADVNVTEYYRQSLKPGDGFVKWVGCSQGDELLGYVDVWQVWLAIPQDVKAAEKWLEDHLSALMAALHTEVIVTSATPAELLLGATAVNGLIIEGSLSAG